jgi:hypothetical protein
MSLGKLILSRRAIAVVVVAFAVLALGLWWLNSRADAAPETVAGWARPNMTGTAIWLADSPDATGDGEGYIIAGARWAATDNLWHEGDDSPTCVGTDTTASIHVELGVVHVDSDHGAWSHVVWLRCLD